MSRRQLFFRLLLSCSVLLLITILSCGDETPQGPEIPVNTPDTIPPGAVTNLDAKIPTAKSIALVWVAPGDDGFSGQASRYDIRYFSSVITDQNWDSATALTRLPTPKPAGQLETTVATGLPSNKEIYFALKTYDEVQNESGLSNCVMEKTAQEKIAPASVNDLEAVALTDNDFLLTWTAPGDDGMEGTATAYDIRYAYFPITAGQWNAASQTAGEPVPKPAGSPDSFIVVGLESNQNYYFALKTEDDAMNWSEISNACPALALSKYLWVTPSRVNVGEDVRILFRTSSDVDVTVFVWRRQWIPYQGWWWHVFRHLVDDRLPSGAHIVTWDTMDDDGNPIPEPYEVQYTVKLHWGAALIDTMVIKINPE